MTWFSDSWFKITLASQRLRSGCNVSLKQSKTFSNDPGPDSQTSLL